MMQKLLCLKTLAPLMVDFFIGSRPPEIASIRTSFVAKDEIGVSACDSYRQREEKRPWRFRLERIGHCGQAGVEERVFDDDAFPLRYRRVVEEVVNKTMLKVRFAIVRFRIRQR